MSIKPELRSSLLSIILEATMRSEGPDGIQKSCLSCMFFDEQSEICRKFSQRPPARVIALSCEHYEDKNDIPF